MIRRLFTWRMNLYRLLVGVVVLAIVIPSRLLGASAMWFVAAVCILVVTVAVVAAIGEPRLRSWLQPDRGARALLPDRPSPGFDRSAP
ncbi:MAG: hypothetical protein M3O32_03510 [Actinomycetota bacterium]|nr:hypothetical protein [Actinomycetota bacterium]